MIENKSDLNYYLECDRIALRSRTYKPRFFSDEIWKFEILLRKREYLANKERSNFFFINIYEKILSVLYHIKYKKMQFKLGFTIPLNVFGPGLSIAHYGTIVVADGTKIGANCRIHEGVTIGATNGSSEVAQIGDNVFIGSGAKIIGNVKIANNVAIAANAVVVNDFISENGCTIGGVPAKIISSNTSRNNLICATEIVEKKFFYK